MITGTILVVVGGCIVLAMVGYTLSRPKAPQYAPEPVVEHVVEPAPEPTPPAPIEMDFWEVRQWANECGFSFTRWADLPHLNDQRARLNPPLGPIVRRSL